MASRLRPPPLEPYLGLPAPNTLVLLTGILGTSSNWLVLRYLLSLLRTQRRSPAGQGQGEGDGQPGVGDDGVSVLLLSLLRDFAFWREGAGRIGLDLDGLRRRGRLGFVDGLSGLFAAAAPPQTRGSSVPNEKGQWVLASPAVADVGRLLDAAIDELKARSDGRKVVVIADQLDFLLAAAAGGGEDGVSAEALRGLLLDLREKTHAIILAVASDEPLVAAQATALEKEHAAFVLSLAHEARMVVSLRLLDTGTAKDVSGVMRITDGGDDSGTPVEEKEYLYHVGGDGGVRVFERGQ